jgi:hypothetical protein
MISYENKAEQVEIALLQGISALASFSILHEDTDDAAGKDRITVKAMPRETEMLSPDGLVPVVLKIPVAVTIHLVTRAAATMDTVIAAVAKANSDEASSNATAVALAGALFPEGLDIRLADGGERDTGGDTRTVTRAFDFIVYDSPAIRELLLMTGYNIRLMGGGDLMLAS